MSIHYRHTLAEINLEALRHNVSQVKKIIGPTTFIMGIVKANAYGHGAIQVSRALKGAGVAGLGVATLEEGIELRQGGIRGPVFILDGVLSDECDELLEFSLTPIIPHLSDLEKLGSFLKEKDKTMGVHLKVETGMGRLGFLWSDLDAVFTLLRKYPQIQIEGVCSHLACADQADPAPTQTQLQLFEQFKIRLQERSPAFHLANSAAIIDGLASDWAWVRPGIMLYGAYPHPRFKSKVDLKPVMRVITQVISVKKYPPSTPIGYGATYKTSREETIAVLAIGYADGLPRLLSNQGHVLIHGKKAPIVGRVCMDLTMVDVTEIPSVQMGDQAVVLGQDQDVSITAEDMADQAKTISYEILCGISSRVPRVYINL